jgi:transcriptional regulator with XRE-family HTH domain
VELRKISLNIGQCIRQTRKSMGMSQMELGKRIGVSYQQIQKYENGKSHASVERLRQIANALDMPARDLLGTNAPPAEFPGAGLDEKELEILTLLRKIKDDSLREGITKVVQRLVNLQK